MLLAATLVRADAVAESRRARGRERRLETPLTFDQLGAVPSRVEG
jgi:hypothetical protein